MRSSSQPTELARAWRDTSRLLAVCAAASALVISACGGATGAADATAKATAPVAQATVATSTSAAPSTKAVNPAAPVVNVVAMPSGDSLLLKMDQIAVPAGDVTIAFKNSDTKMNHEIWVYPIQDLSKLLAAKRAGTEIDEADFLKDLAGTSDSIAPGAGIQLALTLKGGLYEIACFETMKSADGKSTMVHFDKGQFATLAAFGAGGPAASIATPSSSISVEMKDGPYGSWIFGIDHLVVSAGNVTFKVTNNMKIAHDFFVYPMGDMSGLVAEGLASGENIDPEAPAVSVADGLEAGKTDTNTITLAPGVYGMSCFMVSKSADGTTFVHRDMGQRIVFWVK